MLLVTFESDKIFLNTNMTPEVFARTRFVEKIREKGVMCRLENGKWSFTPWIFDESIEKDGFIFLCGKIFSGARTADSLVKSDSFESVQKISVLLCNLLENTLDTKIPSANIGAGGIAVSADFTQVLFLPYNLWTTAVMSLGDEEFSMNNGIYINQNPDRTKAIRFTQAVLVYKTITGSFPFPAVKTKERIIDIIDGNYTQLKWAVPLVNSKITSFTERAFARKYSLYPEEEFSSYKKNELEEQKILKFNEDSRKAENRRNKKVAAKRFARAKRTALISVGIAFLVILIIAGNLIKTSLEKPTSRSLSSIETVQMYYTALNELNVDAAKNCTENMKQQVDSISNYFLKTRTRSMYNRQMDTVPPAAWLIKNQTQHNIFGLSQFFIEGKKGSLNVEGPRKNTRPQALTEESGIQLKEGNSKSYDVEYVLLDTTGEDVITATKITEELKLEYRKERWVIVSIEPLESYAVYKFQMSKFAEDYAGCMKPNSNLKKDVLEACRSLEEKYFFIPTEQEIDEGYEYLKKISVFNFD